MVRFQQSNAFDTGKAPPAERLLRPRLARARQAAKGAIGGRLLSTVVRQLQNANVAGTRPRGVHRTCSGRGAGVRAAAALSQRVVVKARVVRTVPAGSRSAAAAHLQYITRHGVGRDGERSAPFADAGLLSEPDLQDFTRRASQTRHQFRFIVSPENAAQMNLERFTQELVATMEDDLGSRLDYVAVAHFDTDNPHVHIVINGRDDRGGDLVISRDYMSAGLRSRACELATRELGLRTDLEMQQAVARDITAERFTVIDRQLLLVARQAPDHMIDLRRVPELDNTSAVRARLTRMARLNTLERLGLAEEIAPGRWSLGEQFQERLQALGRRGDIIKTMHAHGLAVDERVPMVILDKDTAGEQSVTGQVIGKGLVSELHDSTYLIVATTDGRSVYSVLSRHAEVAGQESRPGDMVSLSVQRHRATGAADRNVVEIARGNDGVYEPGQHRARLAAAHVSAAAADPVQNRTVPDPEQFVALHVKRLQALSSRGLVEALGNDRFRVPPDLPARVRAGAAAGRDGGAIIKVTRHGSMPLSRQVDARGLTWTDTALVAGLDRTLAANGSRSAFQKELATHLQKRRDHLTRLGIIGAGQTAAKLDAQVLDRLRALERADAVARLAPDWGTYVDVGQSGIFTGTLVKLENLPSGQHGVVHAGSTFTLAPVDPQTAHGLGRQVAVSMTCASRDDGPVGSAAKASPRQLRMVLLLQIDLDRSIDLGLGR